MYNLNYLTYRVFLVIMHFMKIGNIEIKGFAALAPMAGVADRAMREICISHGAGFTVGELTSSKGVSLGDKKSFELLCCSQAEKPTASQLFGRDPETMAIAAKTALQFEPDFIDINMGCPAPKVAGNLCGSALMRDEKLAESIVKAVVGAVDIPVTVKMRTGWDSENLNAPELAKRCENAGASMITVHGRTRKQMYAPPVDYETIAKVKKAVKIPVVANGDIVDGKTAKKVYELTGCDYVMVGRAAQGNPFIFKQINAFMENRGYVPPTLEEKFAVLLKQVELMKKYKPERVAILESRKHTAWYMTGLKGAANIRRMCGEISSEDDIKRIIEFALEQNKDL